MSVFGRSSEGYGWSFWVGLVLGSPLIGFGVLSLLSHAGATHPVAVGLYVVGAALAHDLVLVPVSLALAALIGPRIPGRFRARVTAGLVASGVVLLFSYPALRGFGRLADNASLLPRDYAFGVLVSLGAIWLTVGLWGPAARAVRRGGRAAGRTSNRSAPTRGSPEEER